MTGCEPQGDRFKEHIFVASETIQISHVVTGSFGEGCYSALVVLDV